MKLLSGDCSDRDAHASVKGAGANLVPGNCSLMCDLVQHGTSRSDSLVHIQALPPYSCGAMGNLVNLYLFHHL